MFFFNHNDYTLLALVLQKYCYLFSVERINSLIKEVLLFQSSLSQKKYSHGIYKFTLHVKNNYYKKRFLLKQI